MLLMMMMMMMMMMVMVMVMLLMMVSVGGISSRNCRFKKNDLNLTKPGGIYRSNPR